MKVEASSLSSDVLKKHSFISKETLFKIKRKKSVIKHFFIVKEKIQIQ